MGLRDRLRLEHADLSRWGTHRRFSLVLCTFYWDPAAWTAATDAVADGGIVAWETFTLSHRTHRPGFRAEWCLGPDDPRLPATFEELERTDTDDGRRATRRLIARCRLESGRNDADGAPEDAGRDRNQD